MENEHEQTHTEQVAFVASMLRDDFDWEANAYPDIRDEFRVCIALEIPEAAEKFVQFGSYKVGDTPYSLYRVLWLCGAKSLDFDDMYKGRLFSFISTDHRCVVSVEFYKYELGLYFYADESVVESGGIGVMAGWPGADNETRCTDEGVNAFVEMVKAIIEHEHSIYAGNDFIV